MPSACRRVPVITAIAAVFACSALTRAEAASRHATDSVVIVNSGSTNRAGFQIVVERSGRAEYTAKPRRFGPQSGEVPGTVRKELPRALVLRLYSDLKAAQPLSSLPEPRCMKSVSFGTTLTLQFNGQKTPDLSCGDGGNSSFQALIRDVKEIVAAFGAGRPSL